MTTLDLHRSIARASSQWAPWALLSSLPIAIAACGGGAFTSGGNSGPNDAGAGSLPDGNAIGQNQACGDRAHANCIEIQTCSVEVLATTYGDEGTCEMQLKLFCLNSLAVATNGNSAAQAEACARAFGTEPCTDYFDLKPVAACVQAKGSFDDGTPCVFAGQCATGFCAIVPGAACGVCAEAPMPGDSCAALTTCGQTLTCLSATKQCVGYATQGAPCGSGQPCGAGLFCVGATAAQQGMCQPAIEQMDAGCDPQGKTGSGCDRLASLTCNSMTKQCAPIVFAAAGQACGANVGGQFAACAGAATCVAQTTDAGPPSICVPAASENAKCDLVAGPFCLDPERCIVTDDASTSGTCQFPSATACP
jgi:hypothetical protein